MKFVHIIGAQCTGKTTLSRAFADRIAHVNPGTKCLSISEVARTVLQLHGFTREDVRAGGKRCLELQRLIMENQLTLQRQIAGRDIDVAISDRSGLDPLVYAHMYCDQQSFGEILNSDTWIELETMLRKSILVVCEPVDEWLTDDGTRLMPLDRTEWYKVHTLFLELLNRYDIQYRVLPASIRSIQDRVGFVQSLCHIDSEADLPES